MDRKAITARLDLDPVTDAPPQPLPETLRGIAQLPVALARLVLGAVGRRDGALHLPHRPAAADRAPRELATPRGVGLAQLR